MNGANWYGGRQGDGCTDFEASLNLILSAATFAKLKPGELPETLLVVSDMQFNGADRFFQVSSKYDKMIDKFKMAGYTCPVIVFVNARANAPGDFPASSNIPGAICITGWSQDIFDMLTSMTPDELLKCVARDMVKKTVCHEGYGLARQVARKIIEGNNDDDMDSC